MKLVKPSYEIWEQEPGLEGIYKQIEQVGRVCYKSEDKITENSAKPFVDRMIKSQHYAMLEHGTVYMFIPISCDKHDYNVAQKYHSNKYSKVIIRNEHFLLDKNGYYITTNLRVLVENGWMDNLKYICESTEFHEKRITVHFITDAGVMREFFRHRVFSMAQESTRYCNYSKDKFNNRITFIIPNWIDLESYDDIYGLSGGEDGTVRPMESDDTNMAIYNYLCGLGYAEETYFNLLERGWKPQEARLVLPLNVKAEGVMTGFISDWKHFFRLRTSIIAETGKPHPQASELADPLYKEFIARKYINN